MKRILSVVLVALMVVAGLTGCGSSKKTSADYHYVYTSDIQNMDYLVTYRAEDHRFNANMVDGLLDNDAYGHMAPGVAESWSHNEDFSEWTFKIRKGVKWVTNEGEEYAEVTAQDFVTGLQHAADFSSSTAYLVEGVIANFSEYEDGTVGFDEVGVKATDDYTLVYTLTGPFTYFDSLTTYSILYPLNKDFLESKGTGCKLGAPVTDQCTFGAVDPTSVLYNGAFILTNNTSKSVIEMTKNENYWDKDNIYINKLTWTYDDGSDDHSIINGFENGTYSYAGFRGTWSTEDFNSYTTKYADNAYTPQSDSTTFNLAFNFNRQKYANTNKTTDAEKVNTQNAIMNVNFRLAVLFGFDRVSYAMQSAGAEVPAKAMIRNTLTPPDFVSVDGMSYGDKVALEVMASNPEAFSDLNLDDGQDAFYDPAKCAAYVEKAKADGISFPVTLDLVVYSNSATQVNQSNSLKNSIEASSNGQILVNLVGISDINAYYAVTYYADNGADSDWDISTATGWSPDYLDPQSYVHIYVPDNGDMMSSIGLNNESSVYFSASDKAAMEKVGLYDYQKIVNDAGSIATDLNSRYAAFTKADAWIIANAFMIPIQCQPIQYVVSKITPFTRQWSMAGLAEYKFKYVQVNDKIITKADYEKAKEAWVAAKNK